MRDLHAASMRINNLYRKMNPKSIFASHVEAEPKEDQVFLPFDILSV